MSQSALTAPGGLSLATMPVRVDRSSSAWSAEIHDGQHWRRIHSRDPLAEAHRQAADLLTTAPSTVVLLGAGLGYLPEALLAQSATVCVVVVEPVSALADAARERLDSRNVLNAGRVDLRTWDARHEPGPLWQVFDRDEPEPTVVVQPALANAFPSLLTAMRDSLSRSIFEGRANAEARRRQAGRYLLNTLGNLDAIAGSADAGALEGALNSLPAVLVAAGPSLDRNLPVLRGLADGVAVIAVDTALRPLLNAGLQPPLAVALDPTDLNARHLVDLPPHDDTWLVAEPSVAPNAVHGFAERLLTFRVAEHHPWPWLASQGLERHLVRVWGSVLTAALDLAIHMGADPIVFAGADLAYTNGQPYCRDATWERSWAELTGRGAAIEDIWRSDLAARQLQRVEDIHGRETDTTPHLVAFRDWLVQRMADAPGRTFVNATGEGILQGASIRQGSLDGLVGTPGTGSALVERLRNVTGRSRHQRRAVASRLAGALMILPTDTQETWKSFGRGTMTPEDLDAAIDAAHRSLGTNTRGDRDSEPAGMLPAAERAARLHAALAGQAVPAGSHEDGLDEALGSITRSLSGCRLRLETASDAFRTPISLLVESTDIARRELDLVEDRLARLVTPATAQSPLPRMNASALVRGAAESLLALHEWLSVAAVVRPSQTIDAPATLRWLIEQATESAMQNAGHAPHDGAPLELATDETVVSLEADTTGLMRRVTGLAGIAGPVRPRTASVTVRRTEAAACDRALALLDLPLVKLDVVDLVSQQLGPTGSCSTFDVARALVTPFNATRSYVLADDGRAEPHCEWDRPVLGAFVVEGTPALYAWRNEARELLYRSAADGDLLIESVPFRPMRGAALPDGASVWCAVEGGLWRWSPGSPPERLVDTPAPLYVHVTSAGVVVEQAFLRVDETLLRRRAATAWLWPFAGDSLHDVALGPDGQCTGNADRDDWRAAAYPFADVVVVEGPGGIAARLAVSYPLTTAWAGQSLLVCTVHGQILLFRSLMDRLAEVCR